MIERTQAQATASRAARSKSLSGLTRAGFVGYGLVHVLLAWLATQIALGKTSTEGDQTGAFALLARNAAGKVVLILVIAGLAAMAIWQLFEAAIGHQDQDGKRRIVERFVSGCRMVVYAVLAYSAAKVVAGSGHSSAASQQKATAGALGSGTGRALVILGGVLVLGVGAGLAIYGLTRAFEQNLMVGQMNRTTQRVARGLGTGGYAAKGVAYSIVGGLLVTASVTYDSGHARGLDAALRTLAGQPYGSALLVVIALGFLAFGLYCGLQARYRKI